MAQCVHVRGVRPARLDLGIEHRGGQHGGPVVAEAHRPAALPVEFHLGAAGHHIAEQKSLGGHRLPHLGGHESDVGHHQNLYVDTVGQTRIGQHP
jgi:hypothetical protein